MTKEIEDNQIVTQKCGFSEGLLPRLKVVDRVYLWPAQNDGEKIEAGAILEVKARFHILPQKYTPGSQCILQTIVNTHGLGRRVRNCARCKSKVECEVSISKKD